MRTTVVNCYISIYVYTFIIWSLLNFCCFKFAVVKSWIYYFFIIYLFICIHIFSLSLICALTFCKCNNSYWRWGDGPRQSETHKRSPWEQTNRQAGRQSGRMCPRLALDCAAARLFTQKMRRKGQHQQPESHVPLEPPAPWLRPACSNSNRKALSAHTQIC